MLAGWHLAFWVLAPLLFYRMLPLDTLELLAWGKEWQAGYYKHPPLGPWLGEAWLQLFGGWLESLYLLAQISLLVTFYYVWRCARLFLDVRPAVLATVILEGSYFHTYLTPNFNMNALQLPLWAGLAFHFLQAMRGKAWHWLAVGLFAALAILAKYSGLLLVVTCVALLLGTRQGRDQLARPWPWIGALIGVLLLLPHLSWLRLHWELPWAYLTGLGEAAPQPLLAHAAEPLRFAAGALLGLLFSGLVFLTVLDRRASRPRPAGDAWMLLLLCFAPLLLSVLYGVVTGSRLKSTWAFPFFNLVGIVAFVYLPTCLDPVRWRRFVVALVAVALMSAGMHLLYKTRLGDSKTRFDGPELAQALSTLWEDRFPGHPLRIVVADHVLAAIVASYAPDRPSMLINGDFSISLWLDPPSLQQWGGLAVCEHGQPCFPQSIDQATGPRTIQAGGQRFDAYLLPPAGTAIAR